MLYFPILILILLHNICVLYYCFYYYCYYYYIYYLYLYCLLHTNIQNSIERCSKRYCISVKHLAKIMEHLHFFSQKTDSRSTNTLSCNEHERLLFRSFWGPQRVLRAPNHVLSDCPWSLDSIEW